ncbi:MAG: hypothetical protein BMS9Abin36_0667 [Gammaproteobacteria bacterium]|nr:MAG: hypothetical protein BMS9Abin36_0667 [Gammaproteobacteria bacterium]
MSTDKRESARMALRREVLLGGRHLSNQFCQTRDISPEGVFVETGETSLVVNNEVELVMSLPAQDGQKDYRLPARVARVTGEGVGLQFKRLGVDTFSAVLGLLYAA